MQDEDQDAYNARISAELMKVAEKVEAKGIRDNQFFIFPVATNIPFTSVADYNVQTGALSFRMQKDHSFYQIQQKICNSGDIAIKPVDVKLCNTIIPLSPDGKCEIPGRPEEINTLQRFHYDLYYLVQLTFGENRPIYTGLRLIIQPISNSH